MSKISGENTKPEIIVRKFLYKNDLRYRVNDKRFPGKPDIVLSKYNTCIFVNGCFWHGHNCSAGKLPKSHIKFWKEKIGKNIKRDKKNIKELKSLGFKVLTIWECELKNEKIKEITFSNLLSKLNSYSNVID